MIIDTFALMTDDFSRLHMIRNPFRIHLSLIQLSYLSFDLALGHQCFKLLSTIQFENMYNHHLLFKSWRLTFDLIFECIPSIAECNPDCIQFIHDSFSVIVSICENQILTLERRWDPLLAFASIWPSHSHSATIQVFCIAL
jgi:hypothetical protein